MRVISFGAGVQSSALVALAATRDGRLLEAMGAFPDTAIFADTGAEPEEVYEQLALMTRFAADRGFPVHTCSSGNLREAWENDKRFASIPVFTVAENNTRRGMLGRNCTRDHKIYPVARKVKEIMGIKPRGRMKEPVDMWIGISLDEISRMRDKGPIPWQRLHYPLIEMRWHRQDCINYLVDEMGLGEPPKSACVFCPYRNDNSWLRLKRRDPEGWAAAVSFDAMIRDMGGRGGIRQPAYLHGSLKPLDEAELGENQLDMFDEECQGYCGL